MISSLDVGVVSPIQIFHPVLNILVLPVIQVIQSKYGVAHTIHPSRNPVDHLTPSAHVTHVAHVSHFAQFVHAIQSTHGIHCSHVFPVAPVSHFAHAVQFIHCIHCSHITYHHVHV